MKTFNEFRREWILDPSKEMIIESEILSAYDKYKLNLLTIPVVSESALSDDDEIIVLTDCPHEKSGWCSSKKYCEHKLPNDENDDVGCELAL